MPAQGVRVGSMGWGVLAVVCFQPSHPSSLGFHVHRNLCPKPMPGDAVHKHTVTLRGSAWPVCLSLPLPFPLSHMAWQPGRGTTSRRLPSSCFCIVHTLQSDRPKDAQACHCRLGVVGGSHKGGPSYLIFPSTTLMLRGASAEGLSSASSMKALCFFTPVDLTVFQLSVGCY